ncbi:hypothetical protein KJ966_02535 [bacterium]|nr:hypothetical protein [bacterium]
MNIKSLLIPVVPVLLLFLLSCTRYQLDSGTYAMSVILPNQQVNPPKLVTVSVDENRILIKNNEQEGEFQGVLDGNKIIIKGSDKETQVEFIGTLVGNNTIEGSAVQKAGNEVTYTAKFTLVKNE